MRNLYHIASTFIKPNIDNIFIGISNTVLPTITYSGDLYYKTSLVCSQGTWVNAATFEYLWYKNDTPTSNTTNTWVLGEGDQNSTFFCTVRGIVLNGQSSQLVQSNITITTSDFDFTSYPVEFTSPSFEAVGDADLYNLVTGDSIRVNIGEWTDGVQYPFDDSDFTYYVYIYRNGNTVYEGSVTPETNITYELTFNPEWNTENGEEYISAEVVVTNTNGSGYYSLAQIQDIYFLLENTSIFNMVQAPSMSYDNLYLGSVITVTPGVWETSGEDIVTLTYQWYRNGEIINGATNTTYTIIGDDHESELNCREIVTLDQTTEEYTVNEENLTINLSPVNTALPVLEVLNPISNSHRYIFHTSTQGQVYLYNSSSLQVVNPGTWENGDVTIAYQWTTPYDIALSGEDTNSYIAKEKDVSGDIVNERVYYCNMQVSNAFGTTELRTPLNGLIIRPDATPAVIDNGSYELLDGEQPYSAGDTIGAVLPKFSGAAPENLEISYQWTSEGSDIEGATNSSLVIPDISGNWTLACKLTVSNSAGILSNYNIGDIMIFNS